MKDRRGLNLWIDAAEGISWRSVKDLTFYNIVGEQRPNGTWKSVVNRSLRYSMTKPEDRIADCGPANVANGYSRIINPEHYEWVSDPACELPQWIELRFKKETEIHSVSAAFDTDLTNPGTCWHPESKRECDPHCAKDYTVEVLSRGNWTCVADVKGNFMRKRTHDFAKMPAEGVRITVLTTWGDRSARIMEIRAE